MPEETLQTLLEELKAEHPDFNGGCLTCTQMQPCKTLQIVARIEALLRDVSQVKQ